MTIRIFRTTRAKVSTALLLAAVAIAGGSQAYAALYGDDCCAPGSPCCHPGAACCHGHKAA